MPPKKWDRQKVIQAIHERQQQGLSLTSVWREDLSLHGAAKTYFGSWQKALMAAEVPGARSHVRWSKEMIIDAIRSRHRRGIISATWQQDGRLYLAARSHFGSWQKALVAAGVKKRLVPRRIWSKAAIVAEIRQRYHEGLPILGIWKHDRALLAAAERHFDSWRKAIEAADIDVQLPRLWSRELVIQEIQARHRQGLPMTNVAKHHGALASAAYKYFGGWRDAMLAAGLESKAPTDRTREQIIQEIRDWHPEGRPKGSVWRENCGLGAAAIKHFGGWHEALKAAGITPTARRWTRDRVLIELRTWRKGPCKAGLDAEDNGLAKAARRYFGSVINAQRAAGVEPRPRGRSDQELIEAIQDHYIKGLPMTGPIERIGIRLYSAARFRFGSWRKAVTAAGLEHALPHPRKKWTKERVITEIQRWHERGLPLTRVQVDYRILTSAALRHFGTWHAALAAAGFAPSHRSWTKETIIAAIQARHSKGLTIRNMKRHDTALEASAVAYFGTWGKALQAAGFKALPRTKWSRERVIAEIQRWHEQGRPLTRVWKEYATLTTAAFKYVGSWRKAVAAAGIDESGECE